MAHRPRSPAPSEGRPPGAPDGASTFAPFAGGLEPIELASGTLYIVSMPIGCAEDITVRALRTLRSVSVVAAENPVAARRALRRYGIATPVVGWRARDGCAAAPLLRQLHEGATAALICDAGTPLVADAGGPIAREALKLGIALAAVPGPVAALAAYVLSGADCPRIAFDGFPPRGIADRREFFKSLASEPRTLILYETRAYLRDTLRQLLASLGDDRPIMVARDITRHSEGLFYGTLAGAAERYQRPGPGEYVLVVTGAARTGPRSAGRRREVNPV